LDVTVGLNQALEGQPGRMPMTSPKSFAPELMNEVAVSVAGWASLEP
jgi:hypothetical protein